MKVSGFMMTCKLYGKVKMKGAPIGRTDSMDIVIHARRSSRCIEGKRAGRTRSRGARI